MSLKGKFILMHKSLKFMHAGNLKKLMEKICATKKTILGNQNFLYQNKLTF